MIDSPAWWIAEQREEGGICIYNYLCNNKVALQTCIYKGVI